MSPCPRPRRKGCRADGGLKQGGHDGGVRLFVLSWRMQGVGGFWLELRRTWLLQAGTGRLCACPCVQAAPNECSVGCGCVGVCLSVHVIYSALANRIQRGRGGKPLALAQSSSRAKRLSHASHTQTNKQPRPRARHDSEGLDNTVLNVSPRLAKEGEAWGMCRARSEGEGGGPFCWRRDKSTSASLFFCTAFRLPSLDVRM